MARAAAYGAYYNVMINLAGIKDEGWKKDIQKKADKFISEVESKSQTIEKYMFEKLK